MIKELETKYSLYESVDAMLSPDTLGELVSKPVSHIEQQPINGHLGLAGSRMSYVTTNAGRYFLKRMSLKADYFMTVTNDATCRSVRLWQYGLLDALLPHVENGIVACALDGDGWAILMEDLTSLLLTSRDRPFSSELIPIFLDAMAYMHATFWGDDRLHNPELGLLDLTGYIDIFAYRNAHKHPVHATSPLPIWIRDGWDMMPEFIAPELYEQMHELRNNPQPLINAAESYPHTLLHNDLYRGNLACRDNRIPIPFDWQLATCSLMTIDLAFFIRMTDHLITHDHEKGFQYYRERLEAYLDTRFNDAQWLHMLDIGRCVDAIRQFPLSVALSNKVTDVERRKRFHAILKRQESYLIDIFDRLSSNLF